MGMTILFFIFFNNTKVQQFALVRWQMGSFTV